MAFTVLFNHFFFFFRNSSKMALLSNSAGIPEQMTSEKPLSPMSLPGPPGSPGLPGKTQPQFLRENTSLYEEVMTLSKMLEVLIG